MAARARYSTTAITKESSSNLLTLLPGADVTLYEPGTTTPLAATIYAGASGVLTKTNPFTISSDALVQFYLEKPQPVKIVVTLGAQTLTMDLEPVEADPRAKVTFHNVTVDDAYADGSTECDSAIQTAINEVAAVGDGVIYINPSGPNQGFQVSSRLTFPGPGNYTVMGPGRTHESYDGVRLLINHQSWPALLFDGAAHVTLKDLSIVYDGTPSAVSTFEGDAAYGAMIGLDGCYRVDLVNLYIPQSYDAIACGTSNTPLGASRLTVRDCELWCQRDGLVIRGASYLNVLGTNQWENRVGQSGSALRWRGPATSDGVLIERLFTEDFAIGVDCRIQNGGQVSNVVMVGCLFDGIATAGVRLHADDIGVGSVPIINKWRMAGNSITGTGAAHPAIGYHYTTGASGTVNGISVVGGEVNAVGRQGVLVENPGVTGRIYDLHWLDHLVTYASSETTNTYDAYELQANLTKFRVTGRSVGQLPIQIPGNTHHRYGVSVAAGCDSFEIDVASVGHGTAAYRQGSPPDGVSRLWRHP